MRTRRRRLVVAGVLLLLVAAAGGVGWLLRPVPLTAEERQYVGWWTSPGWDQPDPASLDPWRPSAVEYRPDRTTRYRMQHEKSGAVRYVVRDELWRAADGHLITSFPRPRRDIVGGLRRGEFDTRHDYVFVVDWDGPDCYRFERVNLPWGWGRGNWPVWRHVRCEPPADAL